MRDKSDEELMGLIRAKERPALEELYDRYVRLVYAQAIRAKRDEHAAKEIVQLVFTKLWTTEKGFTADKGRFIHWLLTVIRNTIIDYHRKEKRRKAEVPVDGSEFEKVTDYGSDPFDSVAQKLLKDKVRQAYSRLSASQAELIDQVYWGGMTLSEVADRRKEPLGTIKSRLHQALKLLRKMLHEEKEVTRYESTRP